MNLPHAISLFLLLPGLCVAVAAQPAASDEAAVTAVVQRQALAWNSGEGNGWGADYLPDADFVNIVGMVLHGRPEIVQRHAEIFAGPFQGSHLVISVRSMKLLSASVALAETDMEVTRYRFLMPGVVATAPGVLRTHMKYVLVKQGDRWWIAAAQNTAVRPAVSQP